MRQWHVWLIPSHQSRRPSPYSHSLSITSNLKTSLLLMNTFFVTGKWFDKKKKDMDHGLPFSRFGLYLTDTTATALHNTISCGPFLSPFGP